MAETGNSQPAATAGKTTRDLAFCSFGGVVGGFWQRRDQQLQGFCHSDRLRNHPLPIGTFLGDGVDISGHGAAIFLADDLIKTTGGKGLIDDGILIQPEFAAAVALGTGLTLLLATLNGMPVSTTHG